MATHSSILAWETQWTEEPGGLQSMGSQRVGHNLANKKQKSSQKTEEMIGTTFYLRHGSYLIAIIWKNNMTSY